MKQYKESILYIIFMVLVLVVTVTKTFPKIVGIFNIEKQLREKQVEYTGLQDQLKTLQQQEQQKTIVSGPSKKIFKPETPASDSESSFSLIFDDIIDIAKYNGLKIYSVQYAYNPQDDEFIKGAPGKFNVCQLDMQVIVDYANLESFLREVLKYPYLLNIQKVELVPYQKNKKLLIANIQLKLYSQI